MILNRGTFHQILTTITAFSNGFMCGIQLGWTAPTLVKLKETEGFAATNEELSWLATSHEIGRFFGPLLAAISVDRIGRKYTLTMCSLSLFISWLMMVFAGSIKLFCCIRILQGATYMVNLVTAAILIAENCTPKMRGPLMNVGGVFSNIAMIIEYALTTYTSLVTAATVNAAIGFCGLSTSLFVKETPYYLAMKGCDEKARKNLMWLRGKCDIDSEVESEMNKISENIQLEIMKKQSATNVLAIPDNYKSVLKLVTLSWLCVMTGYFAITAYSSMIFQPSATFSSREYTIIIGIFPLVVSFILPFIIEKYNRRSLLLCLSVVLGISHTGTFLLISAEGYIAEQWFPWLIFILMATDVAACNIIVMMLAIISGELLPMSVKAIGTCLGAIVYSISATTTVAIFLPIAETYGIQYNFLFYSIASILLFAFVLMVLPETRGKSLVDIQNSHKAKCSEISSHIGSSRK